MSIYVLSLEQNKFYVGKTNDLARRFQEHQDQLGSAWTRKYKPTGIVEKFTDHGFDELSTTLRYMCKYGIPNVRGADYCSIELSSEQLNQINSHITSENGSCYNCGSHDHFISQCTYSTTWYDTILRFFGCKNKYNHNSDTVLTFGKHCGKTFSDVKTNFPDYCRWVSRQKSKHGQFLKFQKYLSS